MFAYFLVLWNISELLAFLYFTYGGKAFSAARGPRRMNAKSSFNVVDVDLLRLCWWEVLRNYPCQVLPLFARTPSAAQGRMLLNKVQYNMQSADFVIWRSSIFYARQTRKKLRADVVDSPITWSSAIYLLWFHRLKCFCFATTQSSPFCRGKPHRKPLRPLNHCLALPHWHAT